MKRSFLKGSPEISVATFLLVLFMRQFVAGQCCLTSADELAPIMSLLGCLCLIWIQPIAPNFKNFRHAFRCLFKAGPWFGLQICCAFSGSVGAATMPRSEHQWIVLNPVTALHQPSSRSTAGLRFQAWAISACGYPIDWSMSPKGQSMLSDGPATLDVAIGQTDEPASLSAKRAMCRFGRLSERRSFSRS